ncbi:Response regulator receiver domain-containing protein [Malonomonas rubra DSM 5091]|uniref:Response regulator receiver domain-containing protein n=1 Tax=Malonomonas rubra DSM 5091 TaxID=1122189 RepID=A0A1M6J964_MALRU|nr:response regulator [Malonomonas rubra]SHJ43276.1 Response regulator receiver domain-containing protein [Malonomonas rubra DSM 5091]
MAKILVVDDEPGLRLLYSAELEDEGYQVISAADCTEASNALKKEQIDLVVLDIQIKQESGLEMLQKIVKEHKGLPVILCSAYNCYKDEFASWLADSYVVKSSNLDELKTEIKRLLKK